MPSYEYAIVNVFTDQRFGGNPLAVLPAAQGLSDAAMQSVAREFNLSETTFVLPPELPGNTARVRIFTPGGELPFAGHPNVGTGFVLARRGAKTDDMVFEEAAGLVRVQIDRGPDGTPVGALTHAPQSLTTGKELSVALTAACAGLAEEDIRTETHYPIVAGVGTAFVIAELVDRAALARAQGHLPTFVEASHALGETGARMALHLYARDLDDPTRLFARCFSPLMGIAEDPATGSANAALAALLASLAPGTEMELAFDIAQGVEMGRPSRLVATARKSAEGDVHATVAGRCVPVGRGQIEV